VTNAELGRCGRIAEVCKLGWQLLACAFFAERLFAKETGFLLLGWEFVQLYRIIFFEIK
jgi:hypothetical protein